MLFKLVFPISGVRDYTLFFRAYDIKILQAIIRRYQNKFIEFSGFVGNVEILLKLNLLEPKIIEVGTIYDYKNREGKSKMNINQNLRQYFWFIKKNLHIKKNNNG